MTRHLTAALLLALQITAAYAQPKFTVIDFSAGYENYVEVDLDDWLETYSSNRDRRQAELYPGDEMHWLQLARQLGFKGVEEIRLVSRMPAGGLGIEILESPSTKEGVRTWRHFQPNRLRRSRSTPKNLPRSGDWFVKKRYVQTTYAFDTMIAGLRSTVKVHGRNIDALEISAFAASYQSAVESQRVRVTKPCLWQSVARAGSSDLAHGDFDSPKESKEKPCGSVAPGDRFRLELPKTVMASHADGNAPRRFSLKAENVNGEWSPGGLYLVVSIQEGWLVIHEYGHVFI